MVPGRIELTCRQGSHQLMAASYWLNTLVESCGCVIGSYIIIALNEKPVSCYLFVVGCCLGFAKYCAVLIVMMSLIDCSLLCVCFGKLRLLCVVSRLGKQC